LLGLAAILLLLWIARAQFAAQFARAYFRQMGSFVEDMNLAATARLAESGRSPADAAT